LPGGGSADAPLLLPPEDSRARALGPARPDGRALRAVIRQRRGHRPSGRRARAGDPWRPSSRRRALHERAETSPHRQPQGGAQARTGDPVRHPGARDERDPMMRITSRSRFRGFSTFRARVFWSIIPIVMSFLVFEGWMNVREHRRIVTEEFEKRGLALASNLSFTSELGALSEDKQLLEAAMRGALKSADVAYVVIHGSDGRILAASGRPVVVEARLGDMAADRP